VAAGECGGRLPSRQASAGLLDAAGATTDSLGKSTTRRSITLEAEQIEARRDELERLRAEVEGLRASLKRLVMAADADRRAIERDLHDGVHQHLVALAVNLELAGQAANSDPAAAKTLLQEMGRDVQQALDETALLAQRIYPTTFEADGLAALLRSAALNAGVRASVDVAAGSNYSPEVGMTVYLCWLDALARGSGETRLTIRVRDGEDALDFEVVGNAARSDADLVRVQDRVEALGGRVTIRSGPGGGVRVSGSLPRSR
jgi:signal transduction histidine kinase